MSVKKRQLAGAGLVLLALLWIVVVAIAWDTPAHAISGQEEYSFRWLDPDKKVSVIQNRKYTKALKPMLSVMGGVGASNAFRQVINLDPRLSFYFFEWLGIEAFYSFGFNSQNATFQNLVNSAPGTFPVIREITATYGITAQFVPWYAKINVFDWILNFDWYFYIGAGALSSQLSNTASGAAFSQQTLFSAFAGTGHLFHLSQNFVVRLDVKGTFFGAPAFGTTGNTTLFSNYDFSAGLGVKL